MTRLDTRPQVRAYAYPATTFIVFLTAAAGAFSPATAAESEITAPAVDLSTLVDVTLQENPELRFYEEEIAAAKEMTRVAGAWENPELSVSAGMKRAKTPETGLSAEGTAGSVSVAQKFDFAGRLGLRKAIAQRDAALAELGLEQFRSALAARIREAAFRLFAAETRLEARRASADRFDALRHIVLQRDPAGAVPRIEARILEGSALIQQRQAAGARLAVVDALHELNQLRGAPIDASLRIRKPNFVFADLPPTDDLIASMWRNNFNVRMRELELEQQGFRVRLAQRENFSDLTVEPFYSEESAFDDERVVGIGLKIPIPVWNRNRAGVAAAAARQRQAETMVTLMSREAERDIRKAAATYTSRLEEMAQWPENVLSRFRATAAEADDHYRLGALPLATYVTVQEQAVEVMDSLLATQEEAIAAGQRLEELSGVKLVGLERSAQMDAKTP